MNTKRIIFWICFLVVLALIVWGLAVAMNKPPVDGSALGTPAPVTAGDNVRGPAEAAITLIEYSDFQCPACAFYYPLVEKLMAEASTTIRMVYRHFPLSQHKHGQLAARASEAAAAQGKFWDMYQLLFENQESWSPLSDVAVRAVFATYAERLGLDKAAYEAALDSAETKGKVLSQQQDGVRIGVNATPTFFVNGKVLVTSPDYNEFKAAIEAAAQ